MRFPDSVLTLTCPQFPRLPDKLTGSDSQQLLTDAENKSSVQVLDDAIRTQDVHVSTMIHCYASQKTQGEGFCLCAATGFAPPVMLTQQRSASLPLMVAAQC